MLRLEEERTPTIVIGNPVNNRGTLFPNGIRMRRGCQENWGERPFP